VKYEINRAKFLPHQLAWWDLPNRMKALVGGYGCGKTYIGAMRLLKLSYVNSGIPGMYISPTYPLAEKTIIPTLKEIMERAGISFTHNQQKHQFTINDWDGQFWIGSGEKPDSLRGPNLWGGGIDEPFIQKREVLEQLLARTRHPNAQHREIFLTGTPEQLNWGYEICTERAKDYDLGMVVGSTLDNTHLPKDYTDSLLSAYNENQIAAYVHGQFVNLTKGRVYDQFDRTKHLIERNDLARLPVVVGMDFNVEKMTCSLAYKGTNWIHVFKQIVLRNSNTFELAHELKRIAPNVTIYPDPAGRSRASNATKSDHQILRDNGFNVIAPKAHDPVKEGVNNVNALLKNMLLTVDPSCQDLISDLERCVWKQGDIDKTDPERTHSSDGLRYLVTGTFPIRKQVVGTIERW